MPTQKLRWLHARYHELCRRRRIVDVRDFRPVESVLAFPIGLRRRSDGLEYIRPAFRERGRAPGLPSPNFFVLVLRFCRNICVALGLISCKRLTKIRKIKVDSFHTR